MRQLSDVLYLSVIRAPGEELGICRRLAQLASVTRDDRFQVATLIQFGSSWAEAVRKIARPGDLVVCLEDQPVRRWMIRKTSLADDISSQLKLPVRVLGREVF